MIYFYIVMLSNPAWAFPTSMMYKIYTPLMLENALSKVMVKNIYFESLRPRLNWGWAGVFPYKVDIFVLCKVCIELW